MLVLLSIISACEDLFHSEYILFWYYILIEFYSLFWITSCWKVFVWRTNSVDCKGILKFSFFFFCGLSPGSCVCSASALSLSYTYIPEIFLSCGTFLHSYFSMCWEGRTDREGDSNYFRGEKGILTSDEKIKDKLHISRSLLRVGYNIKRENRTVCWLEFFWLQKWTKDIAILGQNR